MTAIIAFIMSALPWLKNVWGVLAGLFAKLWANPTARTIMMAIALVAVTAFLAYHQGSSDNQHKVDKAQMASVAKSLKDYDATMKTRLAEETARDQRDADLVTKVTTQTDRLQATTTALTGHINDLSEATSSVRLSLGAVRLLNDAKAGSATAAGTLPGTAAGTPYSDPAASDIGLPGLIQDSVLTAGQYNVMRERCEGLQAWAQRELIDANKARIH